MSKSEGALGDRVRVCAAERLHVIVGGGGVVVVGGRKEEGGSDSAGEEVEVVVSGGSSQTKGCCWSGLALKWSVSGTSRMGLDRIRSQARAAAVAAVAVVAAWLMHRIRATGGEEGVEGYVPSNNMYSTEKIDIVWSNMQILNMGYERDFGRVLSGCRRV